MLIKFNLMDIQEKYSGVSSKVVLSSDSQQIPFNVSMIKVSPNSSTKLHNHHDSEFLIVVSGSGEILLNNEKVKINVGDVVYVESFSAHKIINNNQNNDLIFTSCWWFISSQLKMLIQNNLVGKKLLPENTIIISSFPTPNGPMHLGHLAGPFIAEDIYKRFLKQHNKPVKLVCGLDQNQTWCGIQPALTNPFSDQIKDVFEQIEFQSDLFIEPMEDIKYSELAKELFSKLVSKNILKVKSTTVFICKDTGRYLADCEIVGLCPNCLSKIRGNSCEECFLFVEDNKIINPQPLDNKVTLGGVVKERYYFSLSDYVEVIGGFVGTSKSNISLRENCLRILSRSLPDIPVTHYFQWGYP